MSERDALQDELIAQNAERIARNEEAIKRQTDALEKICAHFYPRKGFWKKSAQFAAKVMCVIVAYLGIAETIDWLWNTHESETLAAEYARVAKRLFLEEGNATGAAQCLEKAIALNEGETEYKVALTLMKGLALSSRLLSAEREPTDDEYARTEAALAEACILAEQAPDDPMPLILKAQSLRLLGDRDRSVDAIEQAVARDPSRGPVLLSACAMNYFAGRLPEARRHLAAAERFTPALPLVAYWRGMFALKVDHDTAAAKGFFSQLIRARPRLAVGHVMLGQVLLSEPKGDMRAARESFRLALTLDAKNQAAILGFAETYEREGNLLVARLWADRALSVDAASVSARVMRARLNGRLGEGAAQITDLTAAVAVSPFRAELYRLRAEAYVKAGDAAKAESDRATAAALEK